MQASIDALRTMQRALLQLRASHRGPLLLVNQGPTPSHLLRHTIPVLADFPCVDVPPHADDSRWVGGRVYSRTQMTHGGWVGGCTAACR